MHALSRVALRPSTPPLVLIVDDSQDNNDMYAWYLSHAGLRVRQAANAEAAWGQILREAPQVVVTDLALPAPTAWSCAGGSVNIDRTDEPASSP